MYLLRHSVHCADIILNVTVKSILLLFQYDEVIRRDSETSSTAPLITSPQGQMLQTLSQVPEDEELRVTEIDGEPGGVQENSDNSNEEADAMEENADA